MGWTETGYSKEGVFEFFSKRWDGPNFKLLDMSLVKHRTAYGVGRYENAFGEPMNLAMVVLVQFSRTKQWGYSGSICYKEMDETAGPLQIEMPKHLFELLSELPPAPTDGSHDPFRHARVWRKEVQALYEKREEFSKQIEVGSCLEFLPDHEVKLTNGYAIRQIEITSKKPLKCRSPEYGFGLRLSREFLMRSLNSGNAVLKNAQGVLL